MLNLLGSTHGGACAATNYSISTQQVHMAKEKNLGIVICSAVVSKEHANWYTYLFHHTVNKAMNRKHGQETVLNAA